MAEDGTGAPAQPGDATRVVGVMPAAGHAHRLGTPGRSKELEPVYRDPTDPRLLLPVCYRLLHAFAEAGISRAFVVTRSSKGDIRAALGHGDGSTPSLEHIRVPDSPSAAYTVVAATRAAGDAVIALGFPDVLWHGTGAFSRLLERVRGGADVALGLFPPADDYATVAVEVDDDGRVHGFRPRESAMESPAWTLAAWRPEFSRMLEERVSGRYGKAWPGASGEPSRAPLPQELRLTAVLRDACGEGLRVEAVMISDRPFLDIGDPGRLEAARRAVSEAGPDPSRARPG